MSNNNLLGLFQQGLRTVVGATTEAIETLQDNQKRNQAINDLNEEWQKKSQVWVEKGAVTEAEARKIIENFFEQKSNSSTNSSPQEIPIESTNDPYEEIKELTAEIISLRAELEKLNTSD